MPQHEQRAEHAPNLDFLTPRPDCVAPRFSSSVASVTNRASCGSQTYPLSFEYTTLVQDGRCHFPFCRALRLVRTQESEPRHTPQRLTCLELLGRGSPAGHSTDTKRVCLSLTTRGYACKGRCMLGRQQTTVSRPAPSVLTSHRGGFKCHRCLNPLAFKRGGLSRSTELRQSSNGHAADKHLLLSRLHGNVGVSTSSKMVADMTRLRHSRTCHSEKLHFQRLSCL